MNFTDFQLIDLTAIFEIIAGIFPVSLQNHHRDYLITELKVNGILIAQSTNK